MKHLQIPTNLRNALQRFLRKHIVRLRYLLCLIIGHRKAIDMLYEDDFAIYTKCCPRCEKPVWMPTILKNIPPPPNSTPEQIESWHNYMKSRIAEAKEPFILKFDSYGGSL
jgi:hypothetical protein